MAVFTYSARDSQGALLEGDVTAATPVDAARSLRSEGKFVVKIAPKGSTPQAGRRATGPRPQASGPTAFAHSKPANRGNKYRPDDLIFFTNQLAVMAETGVSLAEALDACVYEGNSPRFARALDAIIAQVQGGSEFSAALAEHPRIFPPVYVSLIKASEASGMMGPMLRRLATHLENQREMTKKIKGAVTYPIVMFLFAIGVTVFLMTWVLPKFAAIYAGREDKLPVLTRWLMAFSSGLMSYGLYALGALAAIGIGGAFYLRTPAGMLLLEKLRLGTPLVGKLFHKTYLTRGLRTLGTMIQSGVSMLDAVQLTSGVCGSRLYEQMWLDARDRLQTGQQLSEAIGDKGLVPRAVIKMLAAGEKSGQLGPVMERVAIFCDSELTIAIKTMTSLIEPAIVMFLGTVVGGLVLALLLPIFTISKAMH